ncbi:hypothetical protein BKA67DRAFT_537105 [Truncatella angustata]|uniref:Uncharacterized protein n=1 Tax=Truncatella angustata TaxID=152316 RepID=A0A9P8UJU3_9PEZI|nr:uncharacterized protein BKA67DRAFT_537105 [Truncatella angustata]KAH6653421.1 hypothetical protein BKA67DRAFT_537105 [Truncatella angustata]
MILGWIQRLMKVLTSSHSRSLAPGKIYTYFSDASNLQTILDCDYPTHPTATIEDRLAQKVNELVDAGITMSPDIISVDYCHGPRGEFIAYTVKSRALLSSVEEIDRHWINELRTTPPFILVVINDLDAAKESCIDGEDLKSLAGRLILSRARIFAITGAQDSGMCQE